MYHRIFLTSNLMSASAPMMYAHLIGVHVGGVRERGRKTVGQPTRRHEPSMTLAADEWTSGGADRR
jgi:hypothetical protein